MSRSPLERISSIDLKGFRYRNQMAQRYRKSGKKRLILLLVSDFDPDGEEIAHSFARSMRDDFEIEDVHPIKVALNASQVEEYELPPLMQAKKSSSNHKKFVDKYGENVWEVEALPPETLQEILTAAIDSVLDLEAFNTELDTEHDDAHWLRAMRQTVLQAMREAELDLPEEEEDEEEDE